jgi:hypothetical protein
MVEMQLDSNPKNRISVSVRRMSALEKDKEGRRGRRGSKQTHLTALEMMLSTMDCKLMMSPVTKKDE